MQKALNEEVFDFVVIGSGFGGSVSAMRLTEKGYSVLVLERGKRFSDQDFPKTNWKISKYLWAPALRCFGVLQITPFKDVLVLHGSGVGGGSLGYANVLMPPSDKIFTNPTWKHLADWKKELTPHYQTAKRMLGVTTNPRMWPADSTLQEIARDLGREDTFNPTTVGIFFGDPRKNGNEEADPYFGGQGLPRNGCIQCGGCLVGCRYNAKNTLVKNYLYFAEKWGGKVLAESEVSDVRLLDKDQDDGARYEVVYHYSTAWFSKPDVVVRARNVVFSAGSLGTLNLLFRCRDVTGSLPNISRRLGDMVRTNSESLLGASSKDWQTDYSQGISITSIIQADDVTAVEPVRYPAGSSLMRFLAGPLVETTGAKRRFWHLISSIFSQPVAFVRTHILPGWAQRTTILLVMQTQDNRLRMRYGRGAFTLFRRGLISKPDEDDPIPNQIDIGHQVTRMFAKKIGGSPAGALNEALLDIPITAHILGGCPFGRDDQEGVIALDFQVHNYTGLYVVDGSVMPANPGINPSLTITALAEYAMSQVPPKDGGPLKRPLGVQAAVEERVAV